MNTKTPPTMYMPCAGTTTLKLCCVSHTYHGCRQLTYVSMVVLAQTKLIYMDKMKNQGVDDDKNDMYSEVCASAQDFRANIALMYGANAEW